MTTPPSHPSASAAPSPSAWLDQWLEHLVVEKGLSENSLAAYAQDVSTFLDFLAQRDADPAMVTEDDCYLFLMHQRRQGLTNRSAARRLSALRGFFSFALARGLVNQDPTALLQGPKLPRTLPGVLSPDEVAALLEQPDLSTKLGFRDRTMFELLYAAGLRVSELTHMTPLSFDPMTGLVRVLGKGAKERITPLHPQAQEILQFEPLVSPSLELLKE